MVFRVKCSSLKIFIFLWILFCFYASILCDSSDEEEETILEDYLICRTCGSDIALSNFITTIQSNKALVVSNDTLFDKKETLVQILENPLGSRFEVIALKRASCARVHIWSTSYTWFPGYAWKLCLCPKCSSHIGWMFEPIETAIANQIYPSQQGFYLIVLDNIIAESEIKSLIVPENIIPLKEQL